MFSNFFKRRVSNVNHLFNAQYIDPKGLFVSVFNEVPCAAYITDINVNDAYPFLRKLRASAIHTTYQHSHFNHDSGKLEFNVTFLVLNDHRLIEIGGDYVGIYYYGTANYNNVENLFKQLASFRLNKTTNTKIGFTTQNELNNN